jgi:hypothetical protein
MTNNRAQMGKTKITISNHKTFIIIKQLDFIVPQDTALRTHGSDANRTVFATISTLYIYIYIYMVKEQKQSHTIQKRDSQMYS